MGHTLFFLLPLERLCVEVLELQGLREISSLLFLSMTLAATTLCVRVCVGVPWEGKSRGSKGVNNGFADGGA